MIRFILLYLERLHTARTGLAVSFRAAHIIIWCSGGVLFWWQKLVSLGSSGRDASRFKCKCLLSTLFTTQNIRCVWNTLKVLILYFIFFTESLKYFACYFFFLFVVVRLCIGWLENWHRSFLHLFVLLSILNNLSERILLKREGLKTII